MSCYVDDLSLSISCSVSEYFCWSIFVYDLSFGQFSVNELSCSEYIILKVIKYVTDFLT